VHVRIEIASLQAIARAAKVVVTFSQIEDRPCWGLGVEEGMCAALSQAIGRVSNACDLNIPEVAVTLATLVRLLAHCP
jgi:hypothetical protein